MLRINKLNPSSIVSDGDNDPKYLERDQEIHTASLGKPILYACFIFSVHLMQQMEILVCQSWVLPAPLSAVWMACLLSITYHYFFNICLPLFIIIYQSSFNIDHLFTFKMQKRC